MQTPVQPEISRDAPGMASFPPGLANAFIFATFNATAEVVEGRFKGGFHVFGLESDGVGYVMDQFNRDLVSPDAIRAAEDAKKKIIAGEIKVTDAMAQ